MIRGMDDIFNPRDLFLFISCHATRNEPKKRAQRRGRNPPPLGNPPPYLRRKTARKVSILTEARTRAGADTGAFTTPLVATQGWVSAKGACLRQNTYLTRNQACREAGRARQGCGFPKGEGESVPLALLARFFRPFLPRSKKGHPKSLGLKMASFNEQNPPRSPFPPPS